MALALLSVAPVTENVLRLIFSEAVYWSGLLDQNDASNPVNYAVAPVAGTVGADGKPTRNVSVGFPMISPVANAIDLQLDRLMSGYPAQYAVTVTNLIGGSLDTPDPLDPTQSSAISSGLAWVPPTPDVHATSSGQDFANPQSAASAGQNVPQPVGITPLLGTYVVNAQGDYATDKGLANYRKRILRRVSSSLNGFAHLKNYGLGPMANIKQLDRGGAAETLAKNAEQQIRQEPETASVKVQLSRPSPGEVWLNIIAVMRTGQTVGLQVPVPVS